MNSRQQRLVIDRRNRRDARLVFTERLTRIKADLDARGVGSRVAGTVMEGTSDAIDAGLDVAKERKAVVAGAIGALLLWIFRQPLFDAAVALVARVRGEKDHETEDDSREQSQ